MLPKIKICFFVKVPFSGILRVRAWSFCKIVMSWVKTEQIQNHEIVGAKIIVIRLKIAMFDQLNVQKGAPEALFVCNFIK